MVERFSLKEHFHFGDVHLEFMKGLIVFSGPSGAGKTLLIDAILSTFGLSKPSALSTQTVLDIDVDFEAYGLTPDDEVIVSISKKDKSRYFINNQALSKTRIDAIFEGKVSFLSANSHEFLSQENLIESLDTIARTQQENFEQLLESYQKGYSDLQEKNRALQAILDDEKRIEELKEFARFEIDKIRAISPKVGEYEELLEIKKSISKKEKISEAIARANAIFEIEHDINEALLLLNQELPSFDEGINELRVLFEDALSRLDELEHIDVEEVLDRIEKLSALNKRFGSIENALKHLETKEKELLSYENIGFQKSDLSAQIDALQSHVKKEAQKLSIYRQKASAFLQEAMNRFLKDLKLAPVHFELTQKALSLSGGEHVLLKLANTNLKNISSGEMNRLKLAFLASMSSFEEGGILILDEIDANVSGEEASAIAKVLKEIAKTYQIFAISHQPQLSSQANQHFLVTRLASISTVCEIRGNERINEIARMVSADNITDEAKTFAKRLLEDT